MLSPLAVEKITFRPVKTTNNRLEQSWQMSDKLSRSKHSASDWSYRFPVDQSGWQMAELEQCHMMIFAQPTASADRQTNIHRLNGQIRFLLDKPVETILSGKPLHWLEIRIRLKGFVVRFSFKAKFGNDRIIVFSTEDLAVPSDCWSDELFENCLRLKTVVQ